MRFSRRRILIAALGMLPLALLFVAWRAASWRPVIRRVSDKPILALVWKRDGRTISSVTQDGVQYQIEVSGLSTAKQQGGSRLWKSAHFSDDGRWLLGGSDGSVELFDVTSGLVSWSKFYVQKNVNIAAAYDPKQTTIEDFTLAPQGDKFAWSERCGDTTKTWIWRRRGENFMRVGTTRLSKALETEQFGQPLAFSPNGHLLASGSSPSTFSVWKGNGGSDLWSHVPGAGFGLAFSPDSSRLAALGEDGNIDLLNARTGAKIFSLSAPSQIEVPLVFSPDGKMLVANGGSGKWLLWDVTPNVTARIVPSGTPSISAFAFSPDSSRLAVGTSNGQVQLWRVK